MTRRLLPILAALSLVSAFWRMPCASFEGSNRIDPIVSPDTLAAHSHVIWGSTGIGFNSDFDDLQTGCTTCAVEQDKSAYWVPSLYFKYDNGTYVEVGRQGQPLVYYTQDNRKVKAFPKGFRMVSGNAKWRDFPLPTPDPPTSSWGDFDFQPETQSRRSIGFNCLNYAIAAEPSFYRHVIPDKGFVDSCKDGLRGEKIFPSCWDGKNLDSDDHQSHVAYPTLVRDGDCPASHPVRLPTLIIEIIFWVRPFIGEAGKYVLSTGDESGQSFHGDFLSGWDEGFLQQALDTCVSGTGMIQDCPLFTIKESNWNTCEYTPPRIAAVEECGSPRTSLCGAKSSNAGEQPPAPIAPPAPEIPQAPEAPEAPVPAPPPPPPPPAVAPPAPLVTPQAMVLAIDAPASDETPAPEPEPSPAPKINVIYEIVTKEEWETTTVWQKRSLPTSEPKVHDHLRRHVRRMHQHHRAHHH